MTWVAEHLMFRFEIYQVDGQPQIEVKATAGNNKLAATILMIPLSIGWSRIRKMQA